MWGSPKTPGFAPEVQKGRAFDSICYMNTLTIRESLIHDARTADQLHDESRRLLVNAVRAGIRAGLTQREIAIAIGRSQPEVSRLLRFQGKTELGRRLTRHRKHIIQILGTHGIRNVRVFGSVARHEDDPDSDVDLLVDLPAGVSLFALARMERMIADITLTEVDIVPASGLRDGLSARVLDEAVPL